jgi:hypothetical protein
MTTMTTTTTTTTNNNNNNTTTTTSRKRTRKEQQALEKRGTERGQDGRGKDESAEQAACQGMRQRFPTWLDV